MKKCRRCSKPATLHITEIHDGQAVALHLCETCAREYLEDASEDSAHNPAAELAAKLEALVAEDPEAPPLKCGNCNITFNEFREHGRLGCPSCYDEFRQELMPLLENIHEEATHVGKRPLRSPGLTEEQSQLIHLRAKQREAIEHEDYEAAARLRDQIAEIESSLHGSPDAEQADADE
ncbi:MAG: UvrB/UvrC motif-containing protein [Fuerstiella sp.]